jgi:hypothetical protein
MRECGGLFQTFIDRNVEAFRKKDHRVGKSHPTSNGSLPHCKTFLTSEARAILLDWRHVNKQGSTDVDLALQLNLVAVCAVFAFVGAVLFGAF